MPLGIVSDKEFESEQINSEVNSQVQRPSNNIDETSPVVTSTVLQMPSVGRTPEVTNVPQSLRKILGEEVATNGLRSAIQLSESLGIEPPTQATLSRFANGVISPNNPTKESADLLAHINGRKTKITKRALNKLNLAMSLMDETKLLGCDAKELSSVAKDMAIVAKQMEPTVKEDEKKDPVQFHFYAPQIRNENHYEVVNAKDNY